VLLSIYKEGQVNFSVV